MTNSTATFEPVMRKGTSNGAFASLGKLQSRMQVPLRSSAGKGNVAKHDSPLPPVTLVASVAILSYLTSVLGSALVLHPQMLSPLWPGCVLLVSVLLLVSRRMWPILVVTAFAVFFFYDWHNGVPASTAVWLIMADTVEIVIAVAALNYYFDGVPRLNSIRALAKFSLFAVILAPAAGAIVGAFAVPGSYWANWRTSFFSEALGFLTLMPAVLSWFGKSSPGSHKSRAYYVEGAALIAGLVVFGYAVFLASGNTSPPEVFYLLVPFMLWSALRFGSTGVSTSVILIAFLAIWGATHGRGPFTEPQPRNNLLSLQFFLFFAAAPFMVLAVLVEERKTAVDELGESEGKFRCVFRDAGIGMAIVSPQGVFLAGNDAFCNFVGYTEDELLGKTVQSLTHPDDWPRFSQRLEQALRDGSSFQGVEKRCLHKSGKVLHGECSASVIRDAHGIGLYFVAEVLDITARKRANQNLIESEERFRLVANTAPVLIWMSGTDKRCTFFNKCWLDFTGRTVEQEMGEGWAQGVHPADLERCLRIYSGAFDARVDFEMEYRLRRHDGKYRWIVDYGVPRIESDGTFCGYIGSCVDITDRKLNAQSLEELSGRLIAAQEQERSRIARELHDDFSQRLALLGIGLSRLWKKRPESEEEERVVVRELWTRNQEISSDVHRLSHQLHSSKLEHVGLGPALLGLCEEISEKYGIQVEFTDRGVASEIAKDVALCLFRVTQEALNNVVKHSRANHARVELCKARHEIRLQIVDAGAGFDVAVSHADAGIGLIGMRERLRLVGGRMSVQSAPMRGTAILAEVPVAVFADEAHAGTTTAGGTRA
jgi:PAS domain S-box-containing protein